MIGVGSTSDLDRRSSFSNYGSQDVWIAAPGRNVITTYPYRTHAAASGTSFSAPMVAGTVALLVDSGRNPNQSQAAAALAHAHPVPGDLGHGRLDIVSALAAWAGFGGNGEHD